MGWVSMNLNRPVKDWFKEMWNDDNREVLDVALVKRTQLYAAVRYKEHVPVYGGQVIAVTYLITWSRGEFNFSYKSMTEHVGPYGLSECPKRIMKLLTPLNSEIDPSGYAAEWRERVKTYHKMNDNLKLKNTVIKFKDGIEFTNGRVFYYFKKEGKKLYAGEMQKNGVFSKISPVRVKILNYMRSGEFEFVECRMS